MKAQWPQMASQYEVSGSADCQTIKELALKQMDLQQRAINVSRNEALTIDQVNDSILSMVRQYKDEVKRQYIFPPPASRQPISPCSRHWATCCSSIHRATETISRCLLP